MRHWRRALVLARFYYCDPVAVLDWPGDWVREAERLMVEYNRKMRQKKR